MVIELRSPAGKDRLANREGNARQIATGTMIVEDALGLPKGVSRWSSTKPTFPTLRFCPA